MASTSQGGQDDPGRWSRTAFRAPAEGPTVGAVDITQHLRVIRRWHRVLVASAVLGTVLAGLFLFKVSPSGVEFRRPEKWESTSTLLVTQAGFPWGRTTLPGTDGTDAPPATAATDPNAAKQKDDARVIDENVYRC